MPGGRYWDRTSGLFRVRETRSRCAKRPWQSSLTEWRIIASMNFASFSCALPEVSLEYRPARGSGSVGRAQPCQGWGRGFEPRLPLHAKSRAGFPVGSFTQMATWPSGKAGACKALTTGSNPVVASKLSQRPSGAFLLPMTRAGDTCRQLFFAHCQFAPREGPHYKVQEV